jgi:hypothetical protein
MLRAGLIGCPAVGKTTLFRLMTMTDDSDRPTHGRTEAHVGISRVPDERLDRLTTMYNPRKRVPATLELADVAAMGRSSAQALLDLAAYRNADALVHVVRAFRSESVPHVAGSVDAARDARSMEDELILADLGVLERRQERIAKDLKKGPSRELEQERAVLDRCQAALDDGQPLRTLELESTDAKRLRGFQFLSAKPLLVVLNIDEQDLPRIDDAVTEAGLDAFARAPNIRVVPVCAPIELEISELEADDAAAFLADLGLRESGLDRVIRASYDLLGYISFFTVGEDECRAWSIPRGVNAQTAAGEIHSDLERGFIRAEVVHYEALTSRGSYAACREHGEVRLEGKEYTVQDGDVLNIRFAT